MIKTCRQCKIVKNAETDFYFCNGNSRRVCKKCTIAKNVKYQKEKKSWKFRFVDEEKKKSYMSEYYANNKAKFIEYRKKFKERYPEYYKEYNRRMKDGKA